ncbi:hypothetical protein P153DRAFT_83124 [Dothidotthia symphoricarpi CBS 119687]|uniref:Uncharacterized protein n=1 Tax=Dothidotthia symphoricarpi CBS 119687 TaxID=1392245 RepID=A0A6A6A200_9PLEO|nr:uncharacterized protein P153DRAFT_83124 [Dothidotthia symphoricarpi CBS 119687]KAF2126002.1 hypothetical protein P153DRAFT_83124 [Dothidotthia symphoricarpi CBS 119687]
MLGSKTAHAYKFFYTRFSKPRILSHQLQGMVLFHALVRYRANPSNFFQTHGTSQSSSDFASISKLLSGAKVVSLYRARQKTSNGMTVACLVSDSITFRTVYKPHAGSRRYAHARQTISTLIVILTATRNHTDLTGAYSRRGFDPQFLQTFMHHRKLTCRTALVPSRNRPSPVNARM